MVIHSKAGTRLHQLIAAGVRGDASDVSELARQLWQIDPVGGTIRASVRGACLSKASSYLRRFQPGLDWTLADVELEVGTARADLVWQHGTTQAVFIDEVKNGAPGIDDPAVADQVRRLVGGGRSMWGSEFRGVRLVQLGSPRRVATWNLVGGRLDVVAGADPEELL